MKSGAAQQQARRVVCAPSMAISCGIVGLPNVGKSTLFNALSSAGAAAANYPFCTIEPNVGVVPGARRAARRAGRALPPEVGRRRDGQLRRHRRPGARRVQGRGARQPVPGQHPRDRRDRPRRALLRGRQRHPRRGPRRSGRRRRAPSTPSCASRTSRRSTSASNAPRRRSRARRPRKRSRSSRSVRAAARRPRRGQAGARAGADRRGAGCSCASWACSR